MVSFVATRKAMSLALLLRWCIENAAGGCGASARSGSWHALVHHRQWRCLSRSLAWRSRGLHSGRGARRADGAGVRGGLQPLLTPLRLDCSSRSTCGGGLFEARCAPPITPRPKALIVASHILARPCLSVRRSWRQGRRLSRPKGAWCRESQPAGGACV